MYYTPTGAAAGPTMRPKVIAMSSHQILLGAMPLTALAVVMGAVNIITRVTEPLRSIDSPVCVVDERTYRVAVRRVDKLLDAREEPKAQFAMTAIIVWLKDEIRTGSKRRRVSRAQRLEYWEARRAEIGHGWLTS